MSISLLCLAFDADKIFPPELKIPNLYTSLYKQKQQLTESKLPSESEQNKLDLARKIIQETTNLE